MIFQVFTAEAPRTQRLRREQTVYIEPKRTAVNQITQDIIGAAIAVHRTLGPGLLESAYQECLCQELAFRGIPFERQIPIPLEYRGIRLEAGYVWIFLLQEESWSK